MRAFSATILLLILITGCAKQETKDPVPHIEFIDFANPGLSSRGGDTATFILSYEDGDGDVFVDAGVNRVNLIFTPYYYDAASNSFRAGYNNDPDFKDTIRHAYTVRQPDNGYYKGKSIRGEIFVPLTSFRENNSQKILKFTGFMVDMQDHKSNTFTSPSYTLDF